MLLESNVISLAKVNDGDQGIPGSNNYVWIKFAKLDDYSDISDDSTDAIYIGIAYGQDEQQESNDPSDYKWSKIKGDDGESAYTVILDNENVSFVTDNNNMPVESQKYSLKIIIFKGTEQIRNFEILKNQIKPPDGLSVEVNNSFGTLTVGCVTGKKIVQNYGTIEIPIRIFNTIDISKVFSYTISKSDTSISYAWFKYSQYAMPENSEMFDETSNNMKYIGVAYNQSTPNPSNNSEDYEWIKMNSNGDYGVDYQILYYKSPYNEIEYIPNPNGQAIILNIAEGIVEVEQGNVSFGQVSWTTIKPDYENGYYLWTALKIIMNDGEYYLYTTPILSNDWNNRAKIGGTQLIRNSKTLIDERIYWF